MTTALCEPVPLFYQVGGFRGSLRGRRARVAAKLLSRLSTEAYAYLDAVEAGTVTIEVTWTRGEIIKVRSVSVLDVSDTGPKT